MLTAMKIYLLNSSEKAGCKPVGWTHFPALRPS